ncbi:MAG: hypothetical protein N2Z21_02180 [Candidatus Sumerlaeaceae bacterium]|nr:hypothetical protein [Candidatus Sumerlaeaceae bacterium]
MVRRASFGLSALVTACVAVLFLAGCGEQEKPGSSAQGLSSSADFAATRQSQPRVKSGSAGIRDTTRPREKHVGLRETPKVSLSVPEVSVTTTIIASATPEVPQEPTLRGVEPNRVKKGEVSTIVIVGKNLQDAKVTFRSATQEIPMQVDAITAGEEILIQDRNFQEFAAGTYDVVVEVKGKRVELPRALTVEE